MKHICSYTIYIIRLIESFLINYDYFVKECLFNEKLGELVYEIVCLFISSTSLVKISQNFIVILNAIKL